MYHTGDPAIHRDFVDNSTQRGDRIPHDNVALDIRPAIKFVDVPTDYSAKLKRAKEHLRI